MLLMQQHSDMTVFFGQLLPTWQSGIGLTVCILPAA